MYLPQQISNLRCWTIHTDRHRAWQQDCSQNKNNTPEAKHAVGQASRQERCFHLHHKAHG